ncbi:aspartate kinase [Parafrankia irregularis]|uniref:aspartate kinase n=1 Tax=Parafrankia irregularis TaxID=795642 RepID=A0A0S4QIS8_9ACTN|nr:MULTISPECIES: hypothetical protein [Parafrankia]MBE3205679.1 hypothetical protein [Parafrankia sp. CH37]CUU55421.1 aspartate kinase [Parafrankia irregularis]
MDVTTEPAPAPAIVLKFGGASFAAPSSHRLIARYVADRLTGGGTGTGAGGGTGAGAGGGTGAGGRARAVVVVSAVAGETDRLSALVRSVSADPDRDLLGTALMTGETVNVALMTAALRDAGLPALALTAADTGFRGTGEPHHADLAEIDPAMLTKLAEPGQVLVIPGGQAVGPDGHPVMLGRNSSDLSAIAAAAALGAPACEIFSDSRGICTADPHLVPDARTLAHLPYDMMITMSRHGAKVLHHSAVAWARDHGVDIRCRSLLPDGQLHSVVGGSAEPHQRETAAQAPAQAPTSARGGAVVVHRTGVVWEGAAKQIRSAVKWVNGVGRSDGDVVVVPPAAGSAVAHLVVADTLRDLTGLSLRRTDLRLVTTMFPDGRLDLRLVPAAEVTSVARAQHGLVVSA